MKDQYLVSCVLSISVMTGSVGAPPVSWLVLFPLFPEEVARLKSKFCDDGVSHSRWCKPLWKGLTGICRS